MIDALAELLGEPHKRERHDDCDTGWWGRPDVHRYAAVEEWDDGDVLLMLVDRDNEPVVKVQAFESCVASGWPDTEMFALAVRSCLDSGTIVVLEEETPPKPLVYSRDRSWVRRMIAKFIGGTTT